MNDQERAGRGLQRSGAEWVATAAVIAAGTSAYADVITFENPDGAGHWYWPYNSLDVTLSAADQAGLIGPTTSFQDYFGDFYPTFSYSTTFQSQGDLEIFSTGHFDNYAAPLKQGTVIGPDTSGGSFNSGTVFEYNWDACDLVYVGYPCYCYYYKNCTSGERGHLPEGVETYLGVRFDSGNGYQYGWVKVIRSWVEVEALAWGFQTEPGVPIAAGAVPCDPDIDGDGNVGVTDVLALLGGWGTDGPGADLAVPTDVVDVSDLLTLLSNWGPCGSGEPLASAAEPPAHTLAGLAHGAPTIG